MESSTSTELAEHFRVLREKYQIDSAEELIAYIDSIAAGRNDGESPESMRETIRGMEMQLESLYAEKEKLEHDIDASYPEAVIESFQSLIVQLEWLYAERERRGLHGLDDEMGALENLQLQLSCLYEERERMEEDFGVSNGRQVQTMLESLTMQLSFLYSERENYVVIDGDSLVIQGPRKYFVKKLEGN